MLFASVNSSALEYSIEDESDWGLEKDAEGSLNTKDAEGSVSILERMHAIEGVDPKAYGVRRGCVSLSRIKHIRFQDDQNAIIDLGRGKKLLLRLHRECTGIKIRVLSMNPEEVSSVPNLLILMLLEDRCTAP